MSHGLINNPVLDTKVHMHVVMKLTVTQILDPTLP
jgi:hypothetical protein